MAKIKQKAGMLGIVMGLVVLAMCAISITGLAIDEWTGRTGNVRHIHNGTRHRRVDIL